MKKSRKSNTPLFKNLVENLKKMVNIAKFDMPPEKFAIFDTYLKIISSIKIC